jgi:uncharacterized membrane protein YfcA
VPDLSFVPVLMIAAFVHGAFGFGFPLVATPLLTMMMDLRTAVLLTLIPTVSINLISILGEKNWRTALRRFWTIPVFTFAGSLLGTQVLLSVDPEPFRLLLALLVIASLLSEGFSRSEKERRVPAWVMAGLGLTLGLLAGVSNIFAPVLVAYALFTRMPSTLMVATFNLTFLTSKSGQIAGFLVRDAFTGQALVMTLWGLPLVLLSLWIGIRLRRRMDMAIFERLLRYALWIIAIALIVDSMGGIQHTDRATQPRG